MTTPALSLTSGAAKRIREITAGKDQALRLAVNGGGCSGFQYEFAIVETPEADDQVFEREGAKVFVDPVSLNYLQGSVLDFEDGLMGRMFKVKNPQAKSSCGCGTSFSI